MYGHMSAPTTVLCPALQPTSGHRAQAVLSYQRAGLRSIQRLLAGTPGCPLTKKGRLRLVAGLTASVRLWEWIADREADRAMSGVSGERHRAMTALSRTLITAGGPASGRVVPISLVAGAYGFSYLRWAPVLTADCEKGVIKWHGTIN
jgi:hypothetical protein